ncbi:O-antigen polymerase [Olleya namhaensis]|uniref:O-antigen polymerase n=1 Tax=Olleya namhaensis TaxID=1144750 RepID=UPI002491695B|nr:O-antigen polymerase [Olleya namhaensis]
MSIEILLIAFFFLILYGVSNRLSKKNDPFSPVKLISFLYLIRNVPYIFFSAIDNDFFNWRVSEYFNKFAHIALEDAFFKYSVIQTVAFVLLLIGLNFVKTPKANFSKARLRLNYHGLKYAVNFCFIIGLVGFAVFLLNVGGLSFLLNNLSNRVELQSGQYALQLRPLMGIATVFSIVLIRLGGFKKKDKIRFYFFLTISVLVFSATGGRKDSLYLIIMSFAAYTYYVNKITFKSVGKLKLLLVGSFVFIYVFVIPLVRSEDGFKKILEGEVSVVDSLGIPDFFSSISYTYIDVFTTNHFSYDNTWNFSTLKTIPSNFLDRKEAYLRPPMDEGTYFVTSIDRGGNYKPLMPRHRLREFSFPIENMGFAYANALLLGVVIFFFLQGVILSFCYKQFVVSHMNPFWFYIYLYSAFNFNFSSLRLMNTIMLFILLGIFYLVYKFFKVK